MKITIVTLFPDMFKGFLDESIVKRAQEKKKVEIVFVNPREFAKDTHKTIDDRPYGGGAGMVMMVDPLVQALDTIQPQGKTRIILTSPRGIIFSQEKAKEYSQLDNLVIIAGHYEGQDERITNFIDEEVSIGDYVLTGGELPAGVIIDTVVRLLSGVLKKDEATEIESFYKVPVNEIRKAVGDDELLDRLERAGVKEVSLLEYPQYTRPVKYKGLEVPDVLLSGNHAEIMKWQTAQSYLLTKSKRQDLLLKEL